MLSSIKNLIEIKKRKLKKNIVIGKGLLSIDSFLGLLFTTGLLGSGFLGSGWSHTDNLFGSWSLGNLLGNFLSSWSFGGWLSGSYKQIKLLLDFISQRT